MQHSHVEADTDCDPHCRSTAIDDDTLHYVSLTVNRIQYFVVSKGKACLLDASLHFFVALMDSLMYNVFIHYLEPHERSCPSTSTDS